MRTNYWTVRIAVAAALAVAGSTFVFAQQSGSMDRQAEARPEPSRPQRYRPTADDFSAFTDARVAAIKAGLRLTAEQEKNWPAFEEAFRSFAQLRVDRILASRDNPPSPPADMLESLQRRADTLGRSATALRQIADATAPLYKSLDDAQKRRFAVLAPMLRPPHRFAMRMRSGDFRHGNGDDLHHGRMMGSGRSPSGNVERPPRGGGPMERIRFESREIQHDDASEPGVGLARESGWR